MKNMWEQTKSTFNNAEIPKDENEAFAQLLLFFMQLMALSTSPGSQLMNAAGQKAWAEMKAKFHENQADKHSEKYNNVEHQEKRLAGLEDLLETSTNKIADLKARVNQDASPKHARELAFEQAKHQLLTEAIDNTVKHLATLKSDVAVNLDEAPESTDVANEDDDLLDVLTANMPNDTLNEHVNMTQQSQAHQPQQATAPVQHPTAPVQQPTVSAHSAPSGIPTATVNANSDPLGVSSPAITPMQNLNATSAVANDSQQTINELDEKLKSFKDDELQKLGIKNFNKVEASQGTTAHINIDMVCSKQGETPKITTQVKAETRPGTEGVTYTMKGDLLPAQKTQTIEQICEMAVRTAKPGTVLSVPTADKDKKEHIEKALNAAFKKVYPEHKSGNFTIPDKPKHKPGLGFN